MATDPAGPAPINAGRFTKLGVLLAHRVLGHRWLRRWRRGSGPVLFISPKLCIKAAGFTRLAEAHAMRFHKGRGYVLMERVDGESLVCDWLKGMMEQLRGLAPPDGVGVANATGCLFLTNPSRRLSQRTPVQPRPQRILQRPSFKIPRARKLFDFQLQPWPTPVFTHGDLSSLNIMARGDEVVGIVAWETAGWMPPYWEYISTWHVNPYNPFWQEEGGKFLTPFPHALEVEIVRRKYHWDY
ncbi:kinase-like protein [Staphylotrichum tortipilum]|uniref:Kinase-like protein n=1 Tax=Staphylotrichum tortipilum TaxID=2831512 RepID=A0AAN6RSH3_9PEZI|nr:kinase-like protein [Staphylotrichum longicolle]